MNTRILRRPRRGFTLVELLVVIAIIAVLAAMGFAGAQAAISRAKKTKARKICVTMDQAVLSFYDEYGHMPVVGSSTADREVVTDTGDGLKLVTILLGYESETSSMENKKKVRFFEAPEAKAKRDGISYAGSGSSSTNTVEGLFDPWGQPYRVVLDADYDEMLKDPLATGKQLRRRVATYTWGRNKKSDRGGGDDVSSW